MKFLVVLAIAVVCAAADVPPPLGRSEDYAAPIIRSDYNINPDGNSFQYAYETGNGIFAQAEGGVRNPDSEAATLEIRGDYGYSAPDGTPIKVTYVADENGYRAEGSHIPQIPEAILRSLAYIEANRPAYVEPIKPGYVEPNKPGYVESNKPYKP